MTGREKVVVRGRENGRERTRRTKVTGIGRRCGGRKQSEVRTRPGCDKGECDDGVTPYLATLDGCDCLKSWSTRLSTMSA